MNVSFCLSENVAYEFFLRGQQNLINNKIYSFFVLLMQTHFKLLIIKLGQIWYKNMEQWKANNYTNDWSAK